MWKIHINKQSQRKVPVLDIVAFLIFKVMLQVAPSSLQLHQESMFINTRFMQDVFEDSDVGKFSLTGPLLSLFASTGLFIFVGGLSHL